eukprot:g23946.t1
MCLRPCVRSSRALPLRKPTPLAPKLHPATGLPLSRTRGQHLLHNQGVIYKIVEAADIQASDAVYEVGCGTGELTMRLLPLARKAGVANVVVYVDTPWWVMPCVSLCHGALMFVCLIPSGALCVGMFHACRPHRSNLPYKISAPIIFRLLRRISEGHPWRAAVLMLQRHFADRLLSDPGEKGFSRLALNVRLFAKAFRRCAANQNFVKEIHSTVIRLEPRVPAPEVDFNEWDALIRVIFSRRRKTLRAQFKKLSTLAMLEQNYKRLV